MDKGDNDAIVPGLDCVYPWGFMARREYRYMQICSGVVQVAAPARSATWSLLVSIGSCLVVNDYVLEVLCPIWTIYVIT